MAQETSVDSLFDEFENRTISKDSLYRGFLSHAAHLDEDLRDSLFVVLAENLTELMPSTSFEFTFSLVQSGVVQNPIIQWTKCIEQIKSGKPIDTLQLCKSYNYAAGAYHSLNQIEEAKTNYLNIIQLMPPTSIDEELGVAHNNLGAILNNQNDPGGALPNYIRARDIFTKLIGERHYYIGVISNNIGQVYAQLGHYDEQIKIQESGLLICQESVGQNHPMTANIYLNLGIGYRNTGNRKKSLTSFEESLNIREKLNDAHGIIAVLSEIASHHSAFHDFYSPKQIEQAHLNVINTGVTLFDSSHISLRNSYNNYALLLYDSGNLDEALKFLQKAIDVAYPDFTSEDIHDMPTLNQVGNIHFADVSLFENKGYFLFDKFEATGEPKFLQSSFETFSAGDSLIEIIKSELLNGASRSRLILMANDFYINAGRTSWKMYQRSHLEVMLKSTFEYVEKSRNWDLIARYMNSSRQDSVAHNPILKRISKLKEALLGINDQNYGSVTDSLDRLVDVLVGQLKKEYPEYFRFLYQYSVASLDTIQSICRVKKANWLHFFSLGNDKYASILITPDTICVQKESGNLDSLEFHRRALLRKIEERDWTFTGNAHALYDLILGTYSDILQPGILNISSAGFLDNIPFDVLMSSAPDDVPIEHISSKYLVQDYDISLIPSGTFGMATWTLDSTISSSAFVAPDYLDKSLKYHTEEIRVGSEILSGEYIAGHPKEEDLINLLERNDLLHFAGHSYTHSKNIDSIFLLLGDGSDTMFLSELLSAHSSARIAILSSCFSATGKSSAEGNVGLAYGLAFSGTPNVISSLWKVSDREATGIFERYYMALKNGSNSTESLRIAKLQYLKQVPLPARHPYFWANWVYYGHPVIYKKATPLRPWLWVGIIGVGILGLFFWKRLT